jgi:bifunctional DNA-binding transcriptional regulator/antitoxin component of YhaV-PrlF toxin-antitoxin module
MPHEIERETTVTERFSVTIPPAVRRAAGVEAGDMIRWQADDDGSLSVELQRQQYGAFDDLNAVDIGESTDAAADHDLGSREF